MDLAVYGGLDELLIAGGSGFQKRVRPVQFVVVGGLLMNRGLMVQQSVSPTRGTIVMIGL